MKASITAAAGVALIASAFGMKFVSVAQSAGPVFDQVRVIEDVHAVPASEIAPVEPAAAPVEDAGERAKQIPIDDREKEVAEREKALDEREDYLKAFEAKLKLQIDELKARRDALAQVRDSIVAQQTEDVRKLAVMYGTMKARDAAEIMSTMPIESIVKIVDGMNDVQASALLGALAPETAKEVTRAILARSAAVN